METKQINAIQVEVWNEQTSRWEWQSTFANTWNEVKEAGWEFAYLDSDGTIAMTRNGYINRWRNTPVRFAPDRFERERTGVKRTTAGYACLNPPEDEIIEEPDDSWKTMPTPNSQDGGF